MIELKTERTSHRPDQLPSYLRLAAHHHPGADLDITYLTPAMTKPAPELQEGQRYAHLTWEQVALLVRQVWGDASDDGVVRVRDALLRAIRELDVPVAQWRLQVMAPPPLRPAPVDIALQAARLVASDGQQRAVDLVVEDLQGLQDLRLELESSFAAVGELQHVKPWLWNGATSGGRAMSPGGAEHRFEIRLSRYGRPVR